jgi:hypothetical protein
MDNQFKIPFVGWRFGLDSLLGLIPGVGDVGGLLVSSILVQTMAKKGASVWIMLQMLGNIIVDALVGTIPMLGDFFDIGFKANRRNVDLLKKYYASGEPRPNAKWSIMILAIFGLVIYGSFKALAAIFGAISGSF